MNLDKKKSLVVVLSGGIDSAVVLYEAMRKVDKVSLFHGYYSKPSSQHELALAKSMSQSLGIPLEVVDFSGITKMQVGYVDPIQIAADEADMKAEELTASNAISGYHTLLSAAAYFAQITDKDAIAVGLIAEQAANRPKIREALNSFESGISYMNPDGGNFSILTPLLDMQKSEVIKAGIDLGVPFEKTWSCSAAIQSHIHCGKCGQCVERRNAFKELGVDDPTNYAD